MTKLMERQYNKENKQSVAQSAVTPPSIRGVTLPTPSVTTKICNTRRNFVNDKLAYYDIDPLSDADFVDVCTQPIVSTAPNLSCTFRFVLDAGFSKGNLDFYTNHPVSGIPSDVFYAIELFCECYHGHELGCATKIPRQGDDFTGLNINGAAAKWLNYCKAAGVWNGDYETSDAALSSEVKACGCYFIGQARELVDECPGVDLGFSRRP